MIVTQEIFNSSQGWTTIFNKGEMNTAQLVLVFGNRYVISSKNIYPEIKGKYPEAEIVICSTSGEINDQGILDESLVLTAIEFEHTQIQTCCVNINDFENSEVAAQSIVHSLSQDNLNHIFIVSDGQLINGSDLVKGLNTLKAQQVAATGGLAGDGYDFTETLVGLNTTPTTGNVVAVGFYGNRLQVGFGSKGGWDAFGPERKITKSKENVLFELDGSNALEMYKSYLGEAAKELPSSALFYPLSIKTNNMEEPIVRTILAINEADQSMTFAGDVPEGAIARLMRHNPDRLIDGAEQAAQTSIDQFTQAKAPDLAILVSCVGRKIVLGQNIDEEVEVIRDMVGPNTAITGFYSYGEIAPFQYLSRCELHNQTMTVTTFSEV